MVFSSLVFLYGFLPLVLVGYFICRNRVYRNVVLLLFSLVFYAWGEPKYVLIMLLACLEAYFCGLLMEHLKSKPRLRRTAFLAGLVLLIANLVVFKYTNFIWDNLRLALPVLPAIRSIALPIGISFYTFQILSYIIDLYWGEIRVQRNFLYLALYVSFFPQLIAGPIVRYQTIEEELENRQETLGDVAAGIKRFILGLAKKVILANHLAALSELIYGGSQNLYGTLPYWLAATAYALQIYFDFSGYSDMAIGLGRIFGFRFLENFNYPYLSLCVTDFWRRWHISLSSWFRDYVYIPLGGNRVSRGKWIRNLLVVWGLTGLWHGAQWNFILWGLYYGLLLLAEKLFLGKYLKKLPKLLRWLYAMLLVNVGWVIFNCTDMTQMWHALKTMFCYMPTNFTAMLAADTSIVKGLIYVPLGLIAAAPVFRKLPRREGTAWLVLENGMYLILLGVCIAYIISSTYNPFIYFRF